MLGVHGVVPDPPDTAALLRVLDRVQPYVPIEGDDTDGYTHAHALWLTWFRRHHEEAARDVDAPDRVARRIDLSGKALGVARLRSRISPAPGKRRFGLEAGSARGSDERDA